MKAKQNKKDKSEERVVLDSIILQMMNIIIIIYINDCE
jgi:hypothetical protein